ncbi:hypothetical protein ASG56_09350 [Rhodococcus sp. Leaf7]|uniref:lipase family protein n=1 Tax=unclassified Rhodococcus (in: high G+C Gram-positive bacteria) TaxID=192944 RepID=UPI0007004D2B|nr:MULTISPECIES: lipase family protein [unclassified Rhodococcus (in: high G+C Gram-positive bacteria)]KQU07649.1 hypothetical protein ASG56_09350 [Rhodococcus sp. Leaf7]KQU43169.1 hypothetical protein ASG64_09345 [Rhodococcus sp. Leaf247]
MTRTVTVLAVIGGVVLVGVAATAVVLGVRSTTESRDDESFQNSLSSFYETPDDAPAPGELVRVEPISDLDVPGGTAYRMLYGTNAPDGAAAVSSGMLIVPDAPAPPGGRPVLAWAHGTLGFGDECTPSRRYRPTLDDLDFGSWLPSVMDRGWVVAATDYTGIGTAGDPYYLIAKSEAQDVIDSVRAARNYPDAEASSTYVTFGHSQGGHASMSAAMYADLAPELRLVGAAAAAPAALLGPLFTEQYDQFVAWGIGPSVAVSWPVVYPDLPLDGVLSSSAMSRYADLGQGCITQELGKLLLERAEGQQFFASDPMTNPQWVAAVADQTIDVNRIGVPTFVVQSLSDVIVLPNTTALLSDEFCAAASPTYDMSWLGQTTHQDTAKVGGLLAVDWIQDRFDAVPAPNSCAHPLPIAPADPGQ